MGGGIDIIMNENGDAFELTQGLKFVVSNCWSAWWGGGSAALIPLLPVASGLSMYYVYISCPPWASKKNHAASFELWNTSIIVIELCISKCQL